MGWSDAVVGAARESTPGKSDYRTSGFGKISLVREARLPGLSAQTDARLLQSAKGEEIARVAAS